jgi:GntR family transcriptional regulator, transcriptional repressor for pyruvate dehydrogenase complex
MSVTPSHLLEQERQRQTAAGRSVAENVAEAIMAMVRSGELKPGARLLSERDLAVQLGVSRASVRQAIAMLTERGALETRQGAGTTVAAGGDNVFRTPFETLLLLDTPSLSELYEVRELVEVHLAGRAAEHRTPADLAAIEAALKAMRETVDTPADQVEPNVAFHEAVARAAHLPLLAHFVVSLHDTIRAAVAATHPGVRDRMASYDIHAAIYEAIRRGRVMDARRAMTVHMAMATDEIARLETLPKEKETE